MAIQDFYETYTFIEKKSVPDGMGGFDIEYIEGADFVGNVSTDNSVEMRIAEKQGVTSIYTVTIPKNVPLEFSDVIKNKKTNKYYRITSDPEDMVTPKRSNMDFKQCQAETWTKTI